MSWDCSLRKNNETVSFARSHDNRGATYAVGGTREAWQEDRIFFYRLVGQP
jgi:hypothetical protein